jgi:ubiquinone/menaquinone biosynthesis C-methylase UbiE
MIEVVPSSPPPSLLALATAVLHVDRNPERVLEIGCGEGEGVLFLAREFPRARVRGVDPDEAVVHTATRKIGLDPEGRVAIKRGKGRSLPYPGDLFDLVVQCHGRLFPSEVVRVLRPRGHLVHITRKPRWQFLRASPKRLRRAGLEVVKTGEVEGAIYYVGRLHRD